MRVLIVHNRYRQAGGEDTVVANEQALLDQAGWQTRLWCETNDTIAGPWGKVTTAVQASYSRTARDALARVIAEFAPAVVHVHNFFPLLSPSVYDACRAAGVGVVQTLHNYRTICAGGLLTRDGHPCEDCIRGSPYQGALHGCYRGSHIGSLGVARMIDTHRRRGTWLHKVDRFIAFSALSKGKFVEAGFPAERIAVKPNFTCDRAVPGSGTRAGALYAGRLSPEKGITTLLRAWNALQVTLRVAGDGPLRELVATAAGPRIVALGWKTPAELAAEMAQAAFLIVPSTVSETFGMVIIEAFCQHLPVIASRRGALAEIVNEGVTGLLFAPGDADDLATKVRWADRHPEAMRVMGANARTVYEEKYSPRSNLKQLVKIYEAAIEQSRAPATVRVRSGQTIDRVSVRRIPGEVSLAPNRSGRAKIDFNEPLVEDSIPRGHFPIGARASTLKLTIFGHFVYRGRVGGAEQMFYNLTRGLHRRGADLTLLCGSTTNLDPAFITELRLDGTVRLIERGGRTRRFIAEQRACLDHSLRSDAVLFPNYFVPPVVPRRLGRIVAVLHDMQYRHFPKNSSSLKRSWLGLAHFLGVRKVDTLVVISESVRQDVMRWLGKDYAHKVCVIPNPVSWDRFASELTETPPLPNPYVLTVAAQYKHKNLETLVRAFAYVARVDRDIQLVFCGQDFRRLVGITGAGTDLSALAAELSIADRVHFTGYLDDGELGRWYRGATMFAFPSLFEGFGMPPVEALGFGLPTLTTKVTSLTDTTLGLAHYIDAPLDSAEWATQILEITRNPAGFRPSPQQVARLKAFYDPERIAGIYLRACGAG